MRDEISGRSATWVGSWRATRAGQFFTQDFKFQPLLFGSGDLAMKFAQSRARLFEALAVARIKFWIGEFCLQRVGFRFQRGNRLWQRFQRVFLFEREAPFLSRRVRSFCLGFAALFC